MHDLRFRNGKSQRPRGIVDRHVVHITNHTRLQLFYSSNTCLMIYHFVSNSIKSYDTTLFVRCLKLILHYERLILMRNERSVTGYNIRVAFFANFHFVGKTLQGGKRNSAYVAAEQ